MDTVIVLALQAQRLRWPNKQLLQSHPDRMQLTPNLTLSSDITAGARTNMHCSLDQVLNENGDSSDLSPQGSPATVGGSKRHVQRTQKAQFNCSLCDVQEITSPL